MEKNKCYFCVDIELNCKKIPRSLILILGLIHSCMLSLAASIECCIFSSLSTQIPQASVNTISPPEPVFIHTWYTTISA